jgi:anti-sigma-K factor RskA
MTVTSDPSATRRDELAWPNEPDTDDAPPAQAAAAKPSAARDGGKDRPSLPIGRLRRADPSGLWNSAEFATWLAGSLEELATLIGVALKPSPTPSEVPGTVVALDLEGSQVRIVVELGPSSDETFGTLMRQLVSSGTKTAVWVCATAREDHLTSVRWLNREITGRLHVVTVDAVRIDDSIPAPILRLALRADGTGPAAA